GAECCRSMMHSAMKSRQSNAAGRILPAANLFGWKTCNVNWDLALSRVADRSFRSMPANDRNRVNAALNAMKGDPFSGDVTALKGEYRGLFRRRVGSWRLIFRSEEHTSELQSRVDLVCR